jgi:hypothetical protein
MFDWCISGLALSGTFVSYWIAFECGGCCKSLVEQQDVSKMERMIERQLKRSEENIIRTINANINAKSTLPIPYEPAMKRS